MKMLNFITNCYYLTYNRTVVILITPWFSMSYELFFGSPASTVCFQREFLSVFEAAGAIFRRHISIYVEDR